ncbi:MAG: helix-turn-helix domain-containing protein [Actinomycetota bacterium]
MIGSVLRTARLGKKLTQAQVAERMGTTQSVISRAEAGWLEPSSGFIERFARAVGQPITVTFGGEPSLPDRRTRRGRVRRALGDYVFDPWERSPGSAEIKSLESDGLTREHFEGRAASRTRR